MQTDLIRIGTRGSALALAQAHETRRRLMQAWDLPEDAFEIVVIRTTGDRIQDRALSEAGGKGLFTKELEESLYDGSIDFAVHSSKDMPTTLPSGLEISAYLPREDVRDVLISAAGQRLEDLPAGAVIGTSSLRRQALLLKRRPDLKVVLFRGNVQTRLAKLEAREVDATLLALAGLNRLGMSHVATETLSAEEFPPAVGQGAICIESRIGDERVTRILAPISDADTGIALTCERAFLHALDGSCRTPLAGYARVIGDNVEFYGLILTPDGTIHHEISVTGQRDQAEVLGRDAGLRIRATAGEDFFQGWN